MKYLRSWLPCALALSLVPSLASADEPSHAAWVQARVQEGLVKPLQQKENNTGRFSRSRPPPSERRVRATQAEPSVDSRGRAFLTYAIDVRWAHTDAPWRENDLVGCAYRGTGEVYVKIGDTYRPATFLLGKKADPVPGVCTKAPEDKRS